MKKKKKEQKTIITLLFTDEELELIKNAASTLEIKGKGPAIRSLALQRARQILKNEGIQEKDK